VSDLKQRTDKSIGYLSIYIHQSCHKIENNPYATSPCKSSHNSLPFHIKIGRGYPLEYTEQILNVSL